MAHLLPTFLKSGDPLLYDWRRAWMTEPGDHLTFLDGWLHVDFFCHQVFMENLHGEDKEMFYFITD